MWKTYLHQSGPAALKIGFAKCKRAQTKLVSSIKIFNSQFIFIWITSCAPGNLFLAPRTCNILVIVPEKYFYSYTHASPSLTSCTGQLHCLGHSDIRNSRKLTSLLHMSLPQMISILEFFTTNPRSLLRICGTIVGAIFLSGNIAKLISSLSAVWSVSSHSTWPIWLLVNFMNVTALTVKTRLTHSPADLYAALYRTQAKVMQYA